MDILVVSDSHGREERVTGLLDSLPRLPDALFFLGDGLRGFAWLDLRGVPLYSVCGNCDLFSGDAENEIVTDLGGKRIFAAHGHRYSVKSGYTAMATKAATLGADIMLFGHTHEPVTETLTAGTTVGGVTLEKNLYILNPGSIGGYSPTFGTVVIRNGQILTSFAALSGQ